MQYLYVIVPLHEVGPTSPLLCNRKVGFGHSGSRTCVPNVTQQYPISDQPGGFGRIKFVCSPNRPVNGRRAISHPKAEVVILSFFFFSSPIPAEGLSGYRVLCTRENMEPPVATRPVWVGHSPGSFSLEGHLYGVPVRSLVSACMIR